MKQIQKPVYWILAAAAILILILILLAADFRRLPWFITMLYDYPQGDKVAHFFLMGLTAFFVVLPLPKRWQMKGLFLLAALISLEEISQGWMPGRNSSWEDWFCSMAGVLLFGFLGIGVSKMGKKPAATSKNEDHLPSA